MWWMEIISIFKAFSTPESNRVTAAETILALEETFKKIQTRHQKSFCKVDLLLGKNVLS
jgi:glycerol-3-phosphate responsive antiterminator